MVHLLCIFSFHCVVVSSNKNNLCVRLYQVVPKMPLSTYCLNETNFCFFPFKSQVTRVGKCLLLPRKAMSERERKIS